jgi:hypothetical protein
MVFSITWTARTGAVACLLGFSAFLQPCRNERVKADTMTRKINMVRGNVFIVLPAMLEYILQDLQMIINSMNCEIFLLKWMSDLFKKACGMEW